MKGEEREEENNEREREEIVLELERLREKRKNGKGERKIVFEQGKFRRRKIVWKMKRKGAKNWCMSKHVVVPWRQLRLSRNKEQFL